MTNKQIASAFQMLGDLMELNEEDDFRIKSYRFAYATVRKVDQPLAEMSDSEIKSLKGIGPAISAKIRELLSTGKMAALEKYKEQVPHGVVEMLNLDGFGPKKIRTVWKELGAESIGELLYACNENRLIELKGFGKKTQEELIKSIAYFQRGVDKQRFDQAEVLMSQAIVMLKATDQEAMLRFVGDLARYQPVVGQMEILMGTKMEPQAIADQLKEVVSVDQTEKNLVLRIDDSKPIKVHFCAPSEFGSKLFLLTGSARFIESFINRFKGQDFKGLATEQEVFAKAGLPFIEPELREGDRFLYLAQQNKLPQLIDQKAIKGVIHTHTTWSDGANTLKEMAVAARDLGYAYIGITDHSQAAFYANGLKPERIVEQWAEMEKLNTEMAPFRILKGIESDILNDGSLDYAPEILSKFDFIVASVHSNLKMSKDKATERILGAISNPYTTILGHPTGRLLLSRQGYELDWERIFAACAKHRVAIELNANPYRLDLDYTLIEQALEAGCTIAINPDAHSVRGIQDIRFGVQTARKGGLEAKDCLNTLNIEEFLNWKQIK